MKVNAILVLEDLDELDDATDVTAERAPDDDWCDICGLDEDDCTCWEQDDDPLSDGDEGGEA